MALFKILHLYSKSMDLYGDYANLTALKRGFEALGHECTITTSEMWEPIDTEGYNLVYIGHGKARNLAACVAHFTQYRGHIIKQIDEGQPFFVTGNARLMFGRTLELYSGEIAAGIGLFDYHGRETGDVFVSDVIASPVFAPNTTTYGFINRTAHIVGENNYPLFNVRYGKGDNENDGIVEGNLYNNYMGTWQMGPLLVRNPDLLLNVMSRMMDGEEPIGIDLKLEREALRRTLDEFSANMDKINAVAKENDKHHAEQMEKNSAEKQQKQRDAMNEYDAKFRNSARGGALIIEDLLADGDKDASLFDSAIGESKDEN